jgi:protein-tyrosine phosphatase
MGAIDGGQSNNLGGVDASDAADAAQAADVTAPAASDAAPAAGAAVAPSASDSLASRGAALAGWAKSAWANISDHAESAAATAESAAASAEQKILDAEEPANTSGFQPNKPPSLAVGALNIAETAAARLGLMHPFKTYNKWVDEGQLMRGSEQSDANWASLQQQGIKTVVNLRYEDNSEAKAQAALGMKNVWLPSYDQSLPTEAEVGQFLKTVNDPQNQPVYVHCEQGVGRTGVMCAAYRMQHDGWTADQAIAEAKQMGMNSSDQEAYIRQLYTDLQSGKLSAQ